MRIQDKVVTGLDNVWVIVGARLLALVAFIAVALFGAQYSHYTNCVSDWADKYTVATTARASSNLTLNNTRDKLLTDLITTGTSSSNRADLNQMLSALASGDLEKIKPAAQKYLDDVNSQNANPAVIKEYTDYLAAYENYNMTVATHPLPAPPKLAC